MTSVGKNLKRDKCAFFHSQNVFVKTTFTFASPYLFLCYVSFVSAKSLFTGS